MRMKFGSEVCGLRWSDLVEDSFRQVRDGKGVVFVVGDGAVSQPEGRGEPVSGEGRLEIHSHRRDWEWRYWGSWPRRNWEGGMWRHLERRDGEPGYGLLIQLGARDKAGRWLCERISFECVARCSASMLSLPVDTVRAFCLRQPRWRVGVYLRLCVILMAVLTVTFFAVAIGWQGALPQSSNGYLNGYYADWLPFLPVSVARKPATWVCIS